MSVVKPFNALYYNTSKVGDLSKVMCPPYDVISEEEQDMYLAKSQYNFIHILLGKDKKNDDKDNNKYTRAGKVYNEWIQKNVLIKDEKPCIYFYKQEYLVQGQRHSRLGFISLMELQDDEDSRVYPHENTHDDAIEDRLKLWKNLNSNLSCIFVCYSDKQMKVDKIFNKHIVMTKPIVDVEDNDKVRHAVWRLDDPEKIKEINDSLANQQLFIADGHHRYKVAMEYRRQRLSRKINFDHNDPFNYVMTYFTNVDSRDLKIFPMHRIVKHFKKNSDFLEKYFRIDRIKSKEELLIPLARAGQNEHAFGLYTREAVLLLRLKNKMLISEVVKEGSDDFKSLDATILKSFVFDKIGIKSDDIIYTNSFETSTNMVDNLEADVCFIMNPVKISQLKAIALNGERMPPKTTYFYPKALSGLTVYKLD